jgi:hypothetical protein
LATYLLTWPALIGLCVLGIWAEHAEARGFAVFWALVAGVTAFFYFNVPLTSVAICSIGYLCFGIVWSFYRYKRFIVAKVESITEGNYRMERIELQLRLIAVRLILTFIVARASACEV